MSEEFDGFDTDEIDLDARLPPLPPMTDGRRPCPKCGGPSSLASVESETDWACDDCGHRWVA